MLLLTLAMLVTSLLMAGKINKLHQQIDAIDDSPVRALDFASNLQITFMQMDIALAEYDRQGDLSSYARIDMEDYFQFFADYLDLVTEHHISTESTDILQTVQIELAQWIRVRDKIFDGTADAISIAPIAKRLQNLLAELFAAEREIAYNY